MDLFKAPCNLKTHGGQIAGDLRQSVAGSSAEERKFSNSYNSYENVLFFFFKTGGGTIGSCF